MAQLWNARFSKAIDETVNDFNASIMFDSRLYKQDIQGSLAHAEMLAKRGIISKEDHEAILNGLLEILEEIENGTIQFSTQYEDIHMAVEELLTNKIGQAGKKLHTGRSRNDQVALDMRMYVKEQLQIIKNKTKNLVSVLVNTSKDHDETVMPGYTHLQRAQPVSFAHYMLAYANMFKRDVLRMESTLSIMNESPLGSGALAGTTYPLDRFMTAELLGFDKPTSNSMDGVSDRDYCIEFLSDASLLMMHLSRLSEEIISWCSWEFKFVELDDAFSTGSSIMPQKKNPDICELIRGKTGRVYGDLMALLTTLKGLPLAYNKDMQEDKECVFDAIDTCKNCLDVFTEMFDTMRIRKDNMLKACQKGFINATDLADYLTKKGIPFRDAYKVSGKMVSWCIENETSLNDLSLKQFKEFHPLFEKDVYEAIDIRNCMEKRDVYGGPSPASVKVQIEELEEFLKEHE